MQEPKNVKQILCKNELSMLQNMGMVSITTCRMVEFMNEFGFAEHTKIFEKNPGVFSKTKLKPFKNSNIHFCLLCIFLIIRNKMNNLTRL